MQNEPAEPKPECWPEHAESLLIVLLERRATQIADRALSSFDKIRLARLRQTEP